MAADDAHGVPRAVQTSLLGDQDRPVGRLVGSVFRGSNADLVAAVAPLYLTGSVLDVTYGNGDTAGGWWRRYTPEPFTSHDLAVDGVDFRCLPEADGSFDSVCFDPPYISGGGPSLASGRPAGIEDYRTRFGLTAGQSLETTFGIIGAGLVECRRVCRQWLLVKCCDFVEGGRFRLGHLFVLDQARALGLSVHDLIVHETGPGPGGTNIWRQIRARRCHSYLIVLGCD